MGRKRLTTVEREFQQIVSKKASSQPTSNNVKSTALIGTCSSMCSNKEITFRTKNHLIHPMETASPFMQMKRENRKGIKDKMVKEYSRPAADKTIHLDSIRTYDSLIITTEYLLEILDSCQEPRQWPTVYGFLADRFRAIRQDLIVQQLPPHQIIQLLELQIPFYLNARKRSEELKIQSYDKKLHHSEMDECFSRWFEAAKLYGEFSNNIMKAYTFYYLNKESIAYEVIETLGFGDDDSGDLLNLVFSFLNKNYSRFFQVFREQKLDYLRNALWIHVGSMRLEALQTFRVAFGAKGVTFPLDMLADILGFPSIKSLEACLALLFNFPNGIPTQFTFAALPQHSLDPSQLSHQWFAV